MKEYQSVSSSIEFEQYVASTNKASTKEIGRFYLGSRRVLSYLGNGSPEAAGYQEAIRAIYGVAYTLKMGLKFSKIEHSDNYFDYKMPPLETSWWDETGSNYSNKDNFSWEAMILVPSFINEGLVIDARNQAISKNPGIGYHKVMLKELDEGEVLQTLHVGSYDKVASSIARIQSYASENKLRLVGNEHEIYLNNPQRTNPDKLKTIIRFSIQSE
ncbi:MAG: GyrI-like domain-containing protein [Candidatus Saccharimonadia bacterium]